MAESKRRTRTSKPNAIKLYGRKFGLSVFRLCKSSSANNASKTKLHIVYTQLHVTAQMLVPQVLQNVRLQHIAFVDEQKDSDPNFSTVSSSNLEEA